jgi:hypothetical protein
VAICYSAGARRPAIHSAQRPNIPHCDCRRASKHPSKYRNSRTLTKGRKEVICTKTRTLEEVTYPAYSSLKNTLRAQGEKSQNPNYSGTRLKP